MFWRLFLHIVASILGLWLADKYLAGVEFTGPFFIIPRPGLDFTNYLETLIFVGFLLGCLNFFVKPILKIIAFPLEIITFGLFGLLINMGPVWLVTLISPKLIISGILPLFLTSLIVWGLSFILIILFK